MQFYEFILEIIQIIYKSYYQTLAVLHRKSAKLTFYCTTYHIWYMHKLTKLCGITIHGRSVSTVLILCLLDPGL